MPTGTGESAFDDVGVSSTASRRTSYDPTQRVASAVKAASLRRVMEVGSSSISGCSSGGGGMPLYDEH